MKSVKNAGKSELFHKLKNLYMNSDNLNMYSLFYQYNLIWIDLYNNRNESLLASFFSTTHGAIKFLNICKALCKKNEVLNVLGYANHKQNSLPMTHIVLFELYQNWLWLAATELDEKRVSYYLNKYKQIYAIMAKKDSANSAAENDEHFFPRAQIEENLVYAVLKRPAPHASIIANTRYFSNTSNFHLYIQAFLHNAANNQVTKSDYRNLMDILLGIKGVSGAKLISHTASFFITCGLHDELYTFLENMFTLLENIKEISPSENCDIAWIKNQRKFLTPITQWLVSLGLIFNKERRVIEEYIERSKRILYTQYLCKSKDNDSQMHVLEMIKNDDTRIDNLCVLVDHNFNPYGFREALKSKSGENMLLNARNLMNPHNPKFSPRDALDLLKCAMNNTYQYGDIYLEYIRCNLLLDFNYSYQQDEMIKEYFFKCSDHIGFLWNYFAKCPGAYTNDLALLMALERYIKNHVFKLLEAYEHPTDGEILIKYPIHLFQTALGMPQDFLNIFLEVHQKPIAQEIRICEPTSNYSWNFFLRRRDATPVTIGEQNINTIWEWKHPMN